MDNKNINRQIINNKQRNYHIITKQGKCLDKIISFKKNYFTKKKIH